MRVADKSGLDNDAKTSAEVENCLVSMSIAKWLGNEFGRDAQC